MINRRIGLAASALVFLLSACNNQQPQSAKGERPAAATAEATEQLLEQRYTRLRSYGTYEAA